MLENFIYALNATVPAFALMLLGWALKKKNILNDAFVSQANDLTFYVTLPILLFCDISRMDVKQLLNGKFIGYCFVVSLICILGIWFFSRLFIKDKSIIGSFVQGSYRGSIAVLGVVLVQNIYGDAGYVPIMIVAAVPLYNLMAVVVLSFESGNGKIDGARIKKTLVDIIKNPMIIAILLALPFAIFGVDLPEMVDKTLTSAGSLATPLALLSIGAGFSFSAIGKKLRPMLTASFLKLILQPLIFLPVAYAMGFRNEQMAAIMIMLGSPTTASSYIMAKNMGNDSDLASGIVVITTLLAAVTLTGWIFLAKTIGAI